LSSPRRIHRLLLVTFATCGAALAVAVPARAGLVVESATNCTDAPLEQPFTRWLDPFRYALMPNGGLEGGAEGWSLNQASVVSGNESFYVHGRGDSHSLAIAPGGSATTATVCVGLESPIVRLFARSSMSLLSLNTLRVEVLFTGRDGRPAALPIGLVTASKNWQPSLPLLVVANLLPVLDGQRTAVAFRFTPQGRASWWIDDVYLDPYRHK
jgi:hypothetical protein